MRTFLVAISLVITTGCQTGYANPSFQVGQIFDVSQKQPIPFENLLPSLLAANVIFLGEEHYTPSHLEAAQKVLQALLSSQRHPALAMEMFSWDGQHSLDQYSQDPDFSVDRLIEDSRWKKNWGGEFADYRPLVTFAKTHMVPLIALNPPRPLVRSVAQLGLENALKNPKMSQWPIGELITDDPEYEQLIFEQIETCHPGMPKHAYRRFFEASIFRDEGMAEVITRFLRHPPSSHHPLVSYSGGGHIQYGIPVPKRVIRKRPGTQILTIYFIAWDPSKENEVQQAIQEGIADFVWLTPLGPKGIQAKCG